MHRLRHGLVVALAVVLSVAVLAGLRILGYDAAPSRYPPPAGAVTPAQAEAVATRLSNQPTVSRSDLAIDLAPAHASSVELFVDGQAFYPAILADIQAARSSVHVQEYGYTTGDIGDQFTAAFVDRATQGVAVRLIVDRFGSHVDTTSQSMFAELTDAGVQVAVNYPAIFSRVGLSGTDQSIDWGFHQLGHFYHRKVFIIDGQKAWIGGAGIEDNFNNGSFHDVFVRVTGDVVAQMQLVFLTDVRFHGGPLPPSLAPYFPPLESGRIPTTMLANVPGEGHRAVTDAIWDLIDHATSRLDIIDPYVADRGTLERIMRAAERGVQVRFIVPERSNSPPVQWAFEDHIADLQAAGVSVYLHPILPHAKVVRADDRVLVGSTNLDAWALYRNWETSVVVDNPQVAATFERQLFEPDVAASTLAVPPRGLQRLLARTAVLFTPLL